MDENEYTDANGVRYVTKPKINCFGCVAEHRSKMCLMLPPCFAWKRKDNTRVIWVKSKKVQA